MENKIFWRKVKPDSKNHTCRQRKNFKWIWKSFGDWESNIRWHGICLKKLTFFVDIVPSLKTLPTKIYEAEIGEW